MKSTEEGILITNKEDEDIIEKLKNTAKEVSKKRKGKPFVYNKNEFYKQYDQRTRRAGIY